MIGSLQDVMWAN